ncbi:nuclear protein export factor [Ordospora pajunii]|uniref:nuclear protein export factor n=1 Tax=Ordospora pajunii TaxID=3039483 RepID=UPI0029526DD8|nr:nuclear protein export factor [Ordospora pajunii]KAH9411571.1 nuclear protein export factor [Ordospora pajunii]
MDDLNARYKDLIEARKNVRSHSGSDGRCMTFCPEVEGLERTLKNDVSAYENEVMVKKHRKVVPGAGREHIDDIRPVHVLLNVVDHLTKLSMRNQSIQMYKFVDNRFKAVLSDLRLQRGNCASAASVTEKIVRIYIVFRYVLYNHPHFDRDMNLSQMKRILGDLLRHYDQENTVGEEDCWRREQYYCYYMLVNLDSKCFPVMARRVDGLMMDVCSDVMVKYRQGNISGFLKEIRRLDFLGFCIAQGFAGILRMRCAQGFKKALTEKLNIEVMKDFFELEQEELVEIMRSNGVTVKAGMVDFEHKGVNEEPNASLVFKKLSTHVRHPECFMPLECADYEIFRYALRKTVYRRIETLICMQKASEDANDGVKSVYEYKNEMSMASTHEIMLEEAQPKGMMASGRAVDNVNANVNGESGTDVHLQKERIRSVCMEILEELVNISVIKFVSGIIRRRFLEGFVLEWQSKACAQRKCGDMLLVVLDRRILSATFKDKLYKSILNTVMPKFMYADEANIDDVLAYKLCVFSAPQYAHAEIYERYRMGNIIVDTPHNLSKRMDEIHARMVNSARVIRARLTKAVEGMCKSKAMEVIVELASNGKNDDMIEENLSLISNGLPLMDCDVYYEEDEIDHLLSCVKRPADSD